MLYTTDTDETTECCVDGYESSDIEYKKWEFCQQRNETELQYINFAKAG